MHLLPDPSCGDASPFLRPAGVFAHQPEVADCHKPKGCLEVIRRDGPDGPISVQERMPHRGELATERDFRP